MPLGGGLRGSGAPLAGDRRAYAHAPVCGGVDGLGLAAEHPPAVETVRGQLDEFLRQHSALASNPIRIRFDGPYSAGEVVEAGKNIGRNVGEFRDALRKHVRIASSPYF